MQETSTSLLQRLREQPDSNSWKRLVDLYTPFLREWLRQYGVQAHDAEDLIQEVLAVVVREMPRFHYDRGQGSFRGWLRTILVNRVRAARRAWNYRPIATGDSNFEEMLEQLQDPHSDLSAQWNAQHDQHVMRRLLEMIRVEFEPTTWRAFQRAALDGCKSADVAAELNLTTNAIFIAKSRVFRRLREEMQGLAD